MARTTDIKLLTDRYIFQTYRRYPLVLTRAKGSWVWDEKGKKYLDFFSGIAVSGIGHNMPQVNTAIRRQVGQMLHSSNYYYTEPAARLAEMLCKRSFAGRVFFCSSGTEANEAAIKLARRYGDKKGRYEIIVFENAFHGRTLGALSATPQPKFRDHFGPLLPGFPVARFNDLNSVARLINEKTAAVMLEPVQGEGGLHAATPAFLRGLRQLADQHQLLLMFDEVQCGLGRTGRLFAYESLGVAPDVMTLAKGLGGGLPIGAMMARDELGNVLGAGDHGSTFGANPVACSAALAVLKILTPAFLRNVNRDAEKLHRELKELFGQSPLVKDIRGLGYMIGIELKQPALDFVHACRQQGLLINCTQNTVLRFLPPLALNAAEKRFALKVLRQVLSTQHF
jgi:predicted acetylornithine/succinylornithine family transaminase